ncbi:MAG: hypothetical protein FJY81_00590 [Candidatus Aminicenantes bacterium]|nr:hypothetical protein [Candidatus Aminicenantes bacterium]
MVSIALGVVIHGRDVRFMRTVLYRVLFHYFDRFLAEYETRFEKEYGFFRPIIKEVTAGHHGRTKRAR